MHGALDGEAGHHAVHRHRLRAAHRKQHARRRAAPGPRGQGRVRRHRRHHGPAGARDHRGAAPAESVGVIIASALEPETILKHPATARLIDLGRPVGIVVMALVHFFLLARYEPMLAAFRNAVAPGSYFAMAHGTRDGRTTDVVERTGKRRML